MIIACKVQHKAPSGNRAYTPFVKFQSDTLQYAKVNFENNKSFYIGRTVETLVNDFDIPFTSVPDGNVVVKKDSITGRFFREIEFSEIIFSPNDDSNWIMLIYFEQIVPEKIYTAAVKKARDSGIDWQYNDWYPIKSEVFGKSIIKDIKVTEFPED